MSFRRSLQVAALLLALASTALAQRADATADTPPRSFVHSLFQDHMVLQRDKSAPVWGWAQPGEVVTVEFAGQKKTASAAADGKWLVKLDALPASAEPRTLTVSVESSKSKIKNRKFQDVLVGDVWVCSGQSNMQGNLEKQRDAAVIAAADHPLIRYFSAIPGSDNGTEVPVDDFWMTRGNWAVCSPQTADKFSRVAYYFGRDLHERLKVPMGMIVVALNGSPIESWMPREALMTLPPYEVDGRFYAADDPCNEIIPHWHLPSTRFNSLIHPISPFGVRGFLWYQGETNAAWRHADDRYAALLQLMIRAWRGCWDGEEIPFITIQLPSTPRDKELRDGPKRSGWAEVQHAQMRSIELPKTGVAICMDLGDGDLHPKTKDKIGARAALAARMVGYGEKIVGMGPTFRASKVEGGAIRVSFDNIGGGLVTNDGEAPRWFALAGDDQQFVWAEAKIDGDSVIVSSPKVAQPVAVRYGWVQTGMVNLTNKEGLPASPFRTDHWNEQADKTPRLKGPEGRGIPWDGKARDWPLAPLALEAQRGNLAGVNAALAAAPDAIKQFNAAGFNVLNPPIVEGRTEVVKLLLEKGADPNLPENSGLYPIHRAAQQGRLEIVHLLLKAGVKVQTETRNPGKATPLFFAAQSDHAEVAKLLLDSGAEIEAGREFYRAGSGPELHTPLYAAFDKSKEGATALLLIERGAKIDQELPQGDCPLHLAARKNLVKVVELLLSKGVDVNLPNKKKQTALEAAAGDGAKGTVEILLKRGAKVTPAALAAAQKRPKNEAVTSLLDAAGKP